MSPESWSALLLLVGGVTLYFAGDWLVTGAAGLAERLGVPPIVVGLTIVAFGTSAPELVVSLTAALSGSPAIALGNVIGSNIANLGLVLGVSALISPPSIDGHLGRRELPVLVVASLLLPLFLISGAVDRWEGALFLAGGVAFVVSTFRMTRGAAPEAGGEAPKPHEGSLAWLITLTVAGLGGLVLGGQWFVEGAVGIARAWGVEERIIGLTIVAVGTSLPELTASLTAAAKGHADLAVGNVIGSNILNLLVILGVTALVNPVQASLSESALDLAFFGVFAAYAAFSCHRKRVLGRLEAAAYVLTYAVFVVLLVVRG